MLSLIGIKNLFLLGIGIFFAGPLINKFVIKHVRTLHMKCKYFAKKNRSYNMIYQSKTIRPNLLPSLLARILIFLMCLHVK